MGNYTSGSEATLPANTTDLTDHTLDAGDLTAVSSNDNSTYVGQAASGEYAVFMFKDTVTGTSIDLTWSGKTDLAPSTSPVKLQVYKFSTTTWVDAPGATASDSTTAADTDFDLTSTLSAATTPTLAQCLDGTTLTCRVWQNYTGALGNSSVLCGMSNGNGGNIPVVDATTYYLPLIGSMLPKTTESEVKMRIPTKGTIRNFRVGLNAGPGDGSLTFGVSKNGAAPTLVTAAITGTTKIGSDLTNSIDVVEGDEISVRYTVSGTVTNTTAAHWGVQFDSVAPKESLLLHKYGGNFDTDGVQFFGFNSIAPNDTESIVQMIAPCNGTIKKLHVYLATAPGSGNSRIFTVHVNGADGATPLTTTISNTATSGSDLVNSVPVTAGQLICVECNAGAGADVTVGQISAVFESETAGDFMLPFSYGAPWNGGTGYISPWSASVDSGAEGISETVAAATFDVKAIYAFLTVAPGAAGKMWDLALRSNGSTSGTVTVNFTNTELTLKSATATVTVTAGQKLSVSHVATDSPAATKSYVSLLGHIAP